MAYFPHYQEDEFENPKLNKFEDNYPLSKSRTYSPNNKDKITQRIIRYFEDPKEAKALAEIKKLSDKAKMSSKNLGNNYIDLFGTDDLKNNTELNRVMFKNEGDDYKLEQPIERDPFQRRKFKFSTQKYVPKNENMTLIEEIKDKQNNNNNKDEDNNKHNHKKDNRIIRFSIDNDYDNNKKENNINKNYNSKTSKPAKNHSSNLRRNKNTKSENIKWLRFSEKRPVTTSINDETKKIEIIEGAFDNIPDEYKIKNNATVENLDNKEQIIINEYHSKNKNYPKNYKTEYVWDKTINRLVEKRIYLDKNEINNDNNENNDNNNNEVRKYNNNSVNFRNRYKYYDDEDDNRNKRYNKFENEEKKEKEEKRNANLKYINNKEYDDKDKNKNRDEDRYNKILERKRFGNSSQILKNEMKDQSEEEENEKDNALNQNDYNYIKENRVYRKFRNYKIDNTDEEKPKEVEIIIEKTTFIEKVEDPKYETPEKEKESPNVNSNKRVYKKRINNLVTYKYKNENENENERNNEKKLNKPGIKTNHNYSKRPYYPSLESISKKVYTKKIISNVFPEKKYEKYEEKKPIKLEEVDQEKKYEKKEGEASKINPYGQYKKKHIRIKSLQDEIYNEIEDKKPIVHKAIDSNYVNNKGSRNNKNKNKSPRAASELIEDLEKIENYNVNNYLKNDDLLEIYDNINEEFNDFKNDIFYTNINNFEVNVGEFDKYKIPYLKNKSNAEDICKGRVTTEDMYRKYSQNARKYEKKKLFE